MVSRDRNLVTQRKSLVPQRETAHFKEKRVSVLRSERKI